MNLVVEALWLQIHLPHIKSILVGRCHGPPSSNVQYTDDICTVLQKATHADRQIYFLGDLNIDRLSLTCVLTERLQVVMNVCNLSQICQMTCCEI